MPNNCTDRDLPAVAYTLAARAGKVYVLDEGRSDESPLIRIAHAIIHQGIREHASDIHIEPREQSVQIHHRINGVFEEKITVPRHIRTQLMRRFKIMAELEPFKPGLAQFGSIAVRADGRDYKLQVNFTPELYGEDLLIHITGDSH